LDPVRIGYLIGHLKVGGTQQHLWEVLRRLDRSRFSPRVYCLKRRGAMVSEVERLGVPVEDLDIGNSLTAPSSIARLLAFARELRRCRITLLHCYLPEANFFGALAGRIARIPVVLVSKRSLEPQKNLKRILLSRLGDACADAVLVNSQEVWRYAIESEGCRADKLRLLVNGIDVGRYQEPSNNGSHVREPVVGTVLRLEEVKGPQFFVAAAGRISAEMPEARFVVVGDGSMRAGLERHEAVRALGDRIEFTGERKDVHDILPTFSVFVLPSLVEGMSMALLEAMAAGRPIVATRVGGNIDLIRHGENGLLVSPGEPEEMAHAAVQLLRNPQWAGQLGRAARTAVMDRHGADKMVEDLGGIYEELLAGRRPFSMTGIFQSRGIS
jgi:glycosyltransferase involved in cell wall biosynthesis